jgi:hypothetical protein
MMIAVDVTEIPMLTDKDAAIVARLNTQNPGVHALMAAGDARDANLMRKMTKPARTQGSTPRIAIEVFGPRPYAMPAAITVSGRGNDDMDP